MKRFAHILGTAVLIVTAALIFSVHIWLLFQDGSGAERDRERRTAMRQHMLISAQMVGKETKDDLRQTSIETSSYEGQPYSRATPQEAEAP